MRHIVKIFAFIFLSITLFSVEAQADRRSYVWTYEYMTVPKGDVELEYYFTTTVEDLNEEETTLYEHWVELETGLTDHWDIALYQTFKQPFGAPLAYNKYKIRTRYRFGERGLYLVDPLIYLEYIGNTNQKENEVEGKLILAKDIGKWNIATNFVWEYETESEGGETESETESKFLLASGYEFIPSFKLGAEYETSEYGDYLGPVLSFASGHNWFTIGTSWGLSESANDFKLRFLVGIGL